MTNAPAKPATPAAPAAESADINVRLATLRDEILVIRNELRSFQGKLKNRDPAMLQVLKEENAKLKQRLERMESALFGLQSESLLPRDPTEAKAKVEALRLATVEHCKKMNIDTSVWKKIES